MFHTSAPVSPFLVENSTAHDRLHFYAQGYNQRYNGFSYNFGKKKCFRWCCIFPHIFYFFPSDIFCLNATFYYNCSFNSMSGLIEDPSFAKSSIHCSLSTLLFFSLNIDGPVMNFYKRLDQLCNRPDVYLKLPEKANQNLSFYFP